MSMLKKIFESFCLQRQDFATGGIPPKPRAWRFWWSGSSLRSEQVATAPDARILGFQWSSAVARLRRMIQISMLKEISGLPWWAKKGLYNRRDSPKSRAWWRSLKSFSKPEVSSLPERAFT
jgi:hypothetical protein